MDNASLNRESLLDLTRSSPERFVDLFLELLAETQAFKAEVQVLKEENRLLKEKIKVLEARLDKDCLNSHKPPSSDGYRKPSPKSVRTPPGKEVRRTAGTFRRDSSPDGLSRPRGRSGGGVLPLRGGPVRRGLPHLRVAPGLRLARTPPGSHGIPAAQALLSPVREDGHGIRPGRGHRSDPVRSPVQGRHLHQEQSIPLNRVRQLCSDLFGAVASEATTLEACQTLAGHLSPFRNHVADLLIRSPFPHADETGLRVDTSLCWVHVASTGKVTLYGLHPKRGKEGIESLGVVNRAQGTVVHDFCGPYLGYPGEHAFCNAHLLRELTAVEENDHHAWAPAIRAFLLETKALVEDETFHSTEDLNTARLALFHDLLQRGWEEAGRPLRRPNGKRAKVSPAQNLLRRLEDYSRQVLAFFLSPGTPFTNNQTEQDLRMIKVRQKVSGCFRTPEGAQAFLAIRSYASTLRKQGRDVWAGLTQTMQGRPFLPSDA